MLSVSGMAGYTGDRSTRPAPAASEPAPSSALLPLDQGRQMTIRDESLHAYPAPALCLLTLPEGRFQIETRVHHKCINMSKWDCLKLCFITLELAAVIRNEWWVWVSGLRMAKFSLIYIIFGLDHSLLCFLTFLLAQALLIPIQLPISK